jgi:hypothetical protein
MLELHLFWYEGSMVYMVCQTRNTITLRVTTYVVEPCEG